MLNFNVDDLLFGRTMIETLLQAILEQVDQPKKDLEKNVIALLNEAISKMDLVSKEEIERQKTALNNANSRLTELQTQLKSLESLISDQK
jgi:ubiquinone biosynthesis accessory factor UbiK